MNTVDKIDFILAEDGKKIVYDFRGCEYKNCKERQSKGLPSNCTLKKEGSK